MAIFCFRSPVKAARILWGCQPVSFSRSASDAPFALRSWIKTLDSLLTLDAGVFGFEAFLVAFGRDVDLLALGMMRSVGHEHRDHRGAPTTHSPETKCHRGRAGAARFNAASNALLAAEVQSIRGSD